MIVFGSPSRYVQGPGALSQIGQELAAFGRRAAAIIDPFIQERHGPELSDACAAAGVKLALVPFGGDCTDVEIQRLQGVMPDAQVVVAVGGGKCLDTGKALAHAAGLPIACVPTIASTDAPTSHNYVVYDDHHRLLEVRKLPGNPALVVVDTRIIAQAPARLFSAGIGDAIGKTYEVQACFDAGGRNIFGSGSARTALAMAQACHAILMDEADAALAAVARHEPDAALEHVVEATVLMSGIAFESGGLSVSHSMTRGLSQVPKYAATLHGFQVAYANLVQIRLERRADDEIRTLSDAMGRWGLPRSLAELGGRPEPGEILQIATGTMTSPHIGHFPHPLSAGEIADAMTRVEAAGRS